nr:transposase [Micrococcus yunnanensis]
MVRASANGLPARPVRVGSIGAINSHWVSESIWNRDMSPGSQLTRASILRHALRARGIKAVIPEPADQQGHRRRRGARGGRPIGLDAAAYKGRNVIERQYAHLKQWRGLATRYDKYAIVYRSAVVLNAVIAWSKRLSDMP